MMVFIIVFFVSKYVSLASILNDKLLVVFLVLQDKDVNSSLEIFSIFCGNFNVNNSSKKY